MGGRSINLTLSITARSVQSFSREIFRLGVLWFWCRLLFPNTLAGPGLVLGSTAHSECIVDLELTIVDRGLSDLLISLLWTSNMRCEAPTAGCAEVSLSSVVYAMTGLDNCPLSCCQLLRFLMDRCISGNENFWNCADHNFPMSSWWVWNNNETSLGLGVVAKTCKCA